MEMEQFETDDKEREIGLRKNFAISPDLETRKKLETVGFGKFRGRKREREREEKLDLGRNFWNPHDPDIWENSRISEGERRSAYKSISESIIEVTHNQPPPLCSVHQKMEVIQRLKTGSI